MSKYIKLDDAIKSVADQYMLEASIENPHSCDDIKEWEKVASRVFSDLPTIEVSDGTLKVAKNFYAYTIADENAEMGMRTQIDAIIEVSEDCISRADLIKKMKDYKSYIIQAWNNDFSIMADIDKSRVDELDNCISVVMNAPSVVPKQKTAPPMPSVNPSRAEPEDKQRGRLERFNSVELKKILDNFCEQMACPLPEKTKNEIVANVAGEHAMTVAAERLGQAMIESEERNG